MAEQVLSIHEADGIALLTLNRPEKRNALSRALRDEIVRSLDELAKTERVRVAILTGAGTAFSAGFDRTEFAGGNMVEVFLQSLAYHRRVYTFEKAIASRYLIELTPRIMAGSDRYRTELSGTTPELVELQIAVT